MDFNNLKSSKLHLKQKLIIPIDKKAKVKVVKNSNNIDYYMVKKGDTLESISKAYRVTIQDIKMKNHLKSSLIKVGEKLKIHE